MAAESAAQTDGDNNELIRKPNNLLWIGTALVIVYAAGSVVGLRLEPFETVVERRMLNKLLSIMDNEEHPLHHTLVRQRSAFSNRLLQLRCRRDRYRKSFLPHAIALFNKTST